MQNFKRPIVRSVAGLVAIAVLPAPAIAANPSAVDRIQNRNLGVSRAAAAEAPRSFGDQALADDWPLYRSERGQTAFNDAMATLRATDTRPPAARAFSNCAELACNLALPAIGRDGWIPAGRLWVSPTQYILIVHSPRHANGEPYRRRVFRSMRYFVYHEFENSSRNVDVDDTISAHKGSVFVPLYMSKAMTDAHGQSFVSITEVAPYDVVSIHATNWGSNGPGMEVAKNASDGLEPLQALAGIVIGTIIKTAAPHLTVVNHHGYEGVPMLEAYRRHLESLRANPAAQPVTLPFVPADPGRVAAATGRLDDLILRPGRSPTIPVAERSFLPPRPVMTVPVHTTPVTVARDAPLLLEPPHPAPRPTPRT